MATKSLKDLKHEYASKYNSGSTESKSILTLKRQYNAPKVANDIKSRLDKWDKDFTSLLDGYKSRYFDKDGNYISDKYRSSEDAGNWLYDVETKREALASEGESIKKLLNDYKDYLEEDTITGISSYFDNNINVINDITTSSLTDKEYWDRFESEDEYKEAVQAQKVYEEKTTADLGTLRAELTELEKLKGMYDKADTESKMYGALDAETRWNNSKRDKSALGNTTPINPFGNNSGAKQALDSIGKKQDEAIDQKELLSKLGWNHINPSEYSPETINDVIAEKRAFYNHAEYIQNGIKMASVSNPESDLYDPEFDFYVQKGKDALKGDPGYAMIRLSWKDEMEQMTEEDWQNYFYYVGKGGLNKGTEYLNVNKDNLAYKAASKKREENNTVIERLLFAAESGLSNFGTGVMNLFNTSDDYIPYTTNQIASNMIREDIAEDGKGWQIAYDVINTTANMAPSILTSMAVSVLNPVAGQITGATLMGASASGQAYAEALNLGYTKDQARGYSLLVGASEAGLQYLLGGIGSLGGAATKGVTAKIATKLASNFDKALAKVAVTTGTKLVGNMVAEFGEEYLQEILNPVFKNIALGTNEDFKLYTPDALYAGFLGALSAGLLEGGSTIAGEIGTYRAGKSIVEKGQVDNLAKLGASFSADSVAYKIASQVNKNTDAYTLGQLLREVGADHLSAENIADITASLERKGMSLNDAQSIAKWLNKAVEGEYFTKGQISALENNEIISEVFQDVVLNKDSSVNQRNQEYQAILKAMEKGKTDTKAPSEKLSVLDETTPTTDKPSTTNVVPYSPEYIASVAKAYEEMGIPVEEAKKMAVAQLSDSTPTSSSSANKNLAESKYEVSDDGKTINLKTDKEVNISKIDSISESGEANLTLDDGMVVKASDVAFGSPVERALIEGIGDIKIGKSHISTDSANALYQAAMTEWKSNPNMTAGEAVSLVKGLAESYVYGAYNFGEERLTATDENGKAKYFAGELSQTQRKFAYELGTKDSIAKAEADQKVIDDLVEKAKANKDASSNTKKGSVRFEDGVKAKGKLQKRTVALAKHLARAIGIDIVFYDARTTTNPDGKDANGYFDEDTDTIYLDFQNSHDDAKTIAFTLSHELVHFIKKWSPAKFETFAKFLMEQYGEHGVDTATMLSNKMTELGTTDSDFAYEEMICDACETMLLDSNAIFKLMELRKADLELFDKIKLHIHKLLDKIRGMYKSLGLNPTSDEAKALIEMKDVLEQIYSLFEEASVDAVQNYQAVQTYQVSQKAGFVGKYTNKTYTPAQAELLASLSVEALQNAVDSNGALSFNAIGLGGNKVAQQAWIDAGLTYSEDGNVFVDDNAVMDERDRRREAKSISNQAIENSNRAVFGEASVDIGKTESGIKHQLKNHKKIGEDATTYNERHKNVHKAILQVGIESMYEMAEVMLPYLEEEGILPPDIPGKTIFKNGSYGKTGENTTLCVRTLTYEDFKDRVAETLGRPLTVSESLLVSQKIYDIATEPQCIYCYVAADRKAYDEYLGEYWKAMDKYIKAMRKGGDSKSLYTEYLAGRKDTDAQKKRWASWEAIAKSGKEYISAKDLTTKRKRDALIAKKNAFSEQIKDAQRYAQSASWAKTVFDYRAYKGDILKMSSKFVDMLNSEYGLRMYSFSDYTPAFIVENMQMIIDASVKGLKSLAYTKDTDYAEIFASTGQAINISCFAKWDAESGTYVEDNRQGANWEKTKSLRKQYRNVGAVMVATNDAMVEWALKQDWVDVVIPYHIVKTGTTIANEYQWNNYTSESADRVGNKTANIYPTEHNNDFATYSNLLNERGITPRFSRWYDMVASGELTENQYMKLVNEVRLPASELSAVVPSFNLDAAKNSFGIDNEGKVIKGGFVDKGGYMGGWYRQGVDVNQEVMAVSEDIKAGKSSLDVDYGMSKVAKEKVEEKYTHSIKKQAKKSSRITFGMSDTQRSEILKSKALESPIYEGQADETISINKKDLESQKIGLVKAALVRIGDEFNVFADYDINDVEVKISLSRSNLKESVTKDVTPVQLAKLLPLLKVAVGNAVGIESHSNRYYYDTDTVYFENLLGGYIDGEDFVPIRFGLKHSVSGNTTLYVVVDQNKIKKNLLDNKKTEVVKTTNPHEVGMSASRSVVYNISQIFAFVNSKDLLRYIPDDILSDDQRISKWEAVAETIKKTDAKNDKKYAEYISKGNLYEAQRMVNAAAKEAGAILDDNGKPLILYRGTKGGQTVFAKENTLNGKIYTIDNINIATKYGDKSGKATEISNQVEGEPTTYALYGFPKKMLTLDAQYGVWSDLLIPEELLKYSDGRYKATNAEIAEWAELEGYDALKIDNVRDGSFDVGNEIIFFDENLVKSADTITKDNNDNIIPISERFDSKKRDIRYQKKTATNRTILANSLESAAQNDIERKKLEEYKKKISLIEAEEQRLSEIQKQLFTKGAVEPAQRKALQLEAKQISNRINIYDRQLLNLESTTALKNVLNREKSRAMKRQKQKDTEALNRYKERVAKTTRELMDRHAESRRKATEGRNKTAMRHKIQSVVSELNTLLTHGNKKKHVPEDLKVAVAEVLELFNMDTVGAEERVAKYDALIAKAKDPDVIASLTETRDRIQAQGDKFNARLMKLKSAYDTIKSSADPEMAGGFDEVVSSRIEYVASMVGKTPLRNMTLEQLEAVHDVYTMVLNNIREANTLFKKDKAETIQNYANRVVGEVKRVGGEHEFTSPRTNFVKKYLWDNLKPVYAFEKIGSRTLSDLFQDVRSGEDTWAVDITEAKSFADSEYEKYNYKKWDFDKKYTFNSTTGEQFSLTLDQMLSLYAYSKREQAGDHLRIGGFVFDDSITTYKKRKNGKKSVLKYNVNIAKAHQISIDTLAEIIGDLTNEQKAFVDEMQTYLSDVMGAKGNEVSMTLYNIRLFKEKNYFPLKSAKQFMFEQNEVAGEVRIKNSGFTESTVEHANNPIILNNFMDVWANHVNDMSMYHSFVVPLENFNRVFNYQTRRAEGMPPVSVKETLQNAYGTHAVSYVRDLITDLNGGARVDPRESTSKKLISLFKKAKVFASASVVIQQPSAVARALALVDAKYFDYSPKLIKHKDLWEELKKYAPVAIIKEMGRFDTDIGLSTAEYIKDQKTIMQKAEDVLSKAPAYADELTWVHIWEAVKRETKAKHTDLKVGSEEFLKTAGKRFTEVVSKTQVYDSVLSRSANMRSKTAFMGMITAFMAEPTTSINMVEQGLRLWKRGYKRLGLKQLKGVGASVVLNAALVSLVYAMRDDDEDETYLEKYLGSFVGETLDNLNPLTYLPLVKDAWSLLQGYSVERSDMSLISDIGDAMKGFAQTVYSYDENMTDEEMQKFKDGMVDNSLKLADGIAAIFGIPAGNIRRDIESYINTYKTLTNGFETSGSSLSDTLAESVKNITPVWGRLPDEQKADKLYDAIIDGDKAYVDRLKSGYKDDKAYETALRKALRENDPRIKEAAKARFNGDFDEYERIFKEVQGEGNFDFDTIMSAINTEYNKLGDSNDDETSNDGADVDNVESIYKTSDINTAFENGDNSSALEIIDDIVKVKTENYINDGETKQDAEKKAKSSIKSSMTSYWKPLYINAYRSGNTNEMKRIRNILLSSKLYGRANDVVKTGQDWIKNSKK